MRLPRWGIAWGPAAIWAAVLFLFSEIRGVPLLPGLSANDKLVHGVLYSVMGILLAWGWIGSGRKHSHLLVLGFGLAYAAIDEIHQMFVPYRIPSFADWVADLIGLVLGYGIVVLASLPFDARKRETVPGSPASKGR